MTWNAPSWTDAEPGDAAEAPIRRLAGSMAWWVAIVALPAGVAIGAAATGLLGGPAEPDVASVQEALDGGTTERLTGMVAQDRLWEVDAGVPPAQD